MFLFMIIHHYQDSFITSIMDDYLEKRRKNRRLLYPKKSIYRDSSSEDEKEISHFLSTRSRKPKITSPITKTVTPLKCDKTTEEDVLLGDPHPFGVLPSLRLKNDPLFNMDHVYMKCDFLNFIETEETHAKREHSQVCKTQNDSKKSGPIQKFDKHGYCTECSEYKDRCHNVIYGQYCIDACIRYEKNCDLKSCKLTFKKVFINYYNNALELDQFRKYNALNDAYKWRFPPPCMKRCSYDYVLNWRKWNANGRWLTANDKVPDSFQRI